MALAGTQLGAGAGAGAGGAVGSLSSEQSLHCSAQGSDEKMLHPLLLGVLLGTALPTSFLGTASACNLHLCEGYPSPDGRYHSGFYCPRLTDPPAHRYCCRPGGQALKSCCSQPQLESLRRVNLSNAPTLASLRNPLPLLAVGLYGLLVLTLMTLDFLHFCRLNRLRFYSGLGSSFLHRCLQPSPAPAPGESQQQPGEPV
ncbi:protein shisa-like-1a isoform X1 [Carettochelys insculpta]|uniref:protein shisa-like-1a isoform X1 n=1 Tax=Carettochelys insculpta TaxID=44489 RepID=UPI003EC00A7B